ncbi:MAG: phosphoribosylglycinamide formyltransferase [Clostridiales bacterium]|nr:phosphoribosylglycinamide formyltransferase [Clostridiales bacterium]
MTKVAVLVSGGGTNLQALIDAEKAGGLVPGKLSLVVSNKPGVRALERAEKAGIPSVVLESAGLSRDEFDGELDALLEKNGIEIIVLAGFLKVLGSEFVKKYDKRIINVHPSLIPSFCGDGFYGLKVHQAALDRGVKVTGATVHFVNEITDGGEIILQKAVAIRKNDTAETLQRRVMEQAEWKLLPKALAAVCRNFESEKRSNA